MALSAEEKALRKQRQKVRDALHRQRTSECRKLQESAEREVNERHAAAMQEANQNREDLMVKRNEAVAEIDRQIAALMDKKKGLEEQYGTQLKEASAHYSEVNNARLADLKTASAEVEQQFPDLYERDGARYSAPGWASAGLGKEMFEAALKEQGISVK